MDETPLPVGVMRDWEIVTSLPLVSMIAPPLWTVAVRAVLLGMKDVVVAVAWSVPPLKFRRVATPVLCTVIADVASVPPMRLIVAVPVPLAADCWLMVTP